jgi:DNA-binding MarR family transcriptional regulator
MSEPSHPLRPGRGGRPSPASLGIVKVDADFEEEYPGGDPTCTEAYASLVRTGEALLGELDRRIVATFGISQPAATALAVIDGAGTPLTPSQVSDRVLAASATMTATLDLLERRGWIRRGPNPADRRSVLIEITPQGRATADQLLPGIRTIERSILSALTPGERAHLLDLLAKILARAADVAAGPPEPLHGQRNRPARLTLRP